MKPLAIAVTAFFAAFLGAAGFYFLVQKPDQQKTQLQWQEQMAQMQQQSVTTQQQALQSQVEAIKTESAAAIDEKVAAAGAEIRKVQDEVWTEDAGRRAFSNAIALTGQAKLTVAESYASMLQLCADNQACGLPAAGSFANDFVQSMAIRNGLVEVQLSSKFGDGNRWIRLAPSVDAQMGTITKWRCTTNASSMIPPDSCEQLR